MPQIFKKKSPMVEYSNQAYKEHSKTMLQIWSNPKQLQNETKTIFHLSKKILKNKISKTLNTHFVEIVRYFHYRYKLMTFHREGKAWKRKRARRDNPESLKSTFLMRTIQNKVQSDEFHSQSQSSKGSCSSCPPTASGRIHVWQI
jgi:hypothetical protein